MKDQINFKINKLVREAQLNSCLDLLVNMKKLVTYKEIGDAIGLFAGAAEMARLLGKRMENDVEQGLPIASSLVVNATGIPGEGYFEAAKNCGFKFEQTDEGKRKFWNDQLKKLGVIYEGICKENL